MVDFFPLSRSIARARKQRSLRRFLAIALLLTGLGVGAWLERGHSFKVWPTFG